MSEEKCGIELLDGWVDQVNFKFKVDLFGCAIKVIALVLVVIVLVSV